MKRAGIVLLLSIACGSSGGGNPDGGLDAASDAGTDGGTVIASCADGLAAPSVWVSPGGDDKTCARGDASKPCASFEGAYAVAQLGDVVEIAPGKYGDQAIVDDATKADTGHCDAYPGRADVSSCVTFAPPAGGKPRAADVTIGALGVYTSFVRVCDMTVGGADVAWKTGQTGTICKDRQPHDVVLDGLQFAPDGSFYLDSAHDVSLVNSDIGPGHDSPSTSAINAYDTSNCPNADPKSLIPSAIYLDHDRFHDLIQTVAANGPNCGSDPKQFFCNHMECIHWEAGNGGIVSNSTFTNCAQQDVSVETNGGNVATIDGFTAFNDVFDGPCSGQKTTDQGGTCDAIGSLVMICHTQGDTLSNAKVLFNSLIGQVSWQADAAGCNLANDVEVGNVNTFGQQYGCDTVKGYGVLRQYNGRTTVTCDPTEVLLPGPPYVSATDFHLAPGTAAENVVPTSTGYCPSVDQEGHPRPSGGARCDLGAFER